MEDSVLEYIECFSVRVAVPASDLRVIVLGLHAADIFITDNDGQC